MSCVRHLMVRARYLAIMDSLNIANAPLRFHAKTVLSDKEFSRNAEEARDKEKRLKRELLSNSQATPKQLLRNALQCSAMLPDFYQCSGKCSKEATKALLYSQCPILASKS